MQCHADPPQGHRLGQLAVRPVDRRYDSASANAIYSPLVSLNDQARLCTDPAPLRSSTAHREGVFDGAAERGRKFRLQQTATPSMRRQEGLN